MADEISTEAPPAVEPGPSQGNEVRDAIAAKWDLMDADEAPAADDAEIAVDDAEGDEPDVDGDDDIEAAADADDVDGDEGADDADGDEALTAPARWSKADKAVFDAATPDTQQLMLSREQSLTADYTKKTMELAGREKQVSDIEQALAPYRNSWELNGVTPGAFMTRLLRANDILSNPETKNEGLRWLMNELQISPDDLAGLDTDEEFTDPEVAKLRQEVQSLKGAEEARTAWTRQSQERHIADQVDAFKDATDSAGELLHPHFEGVWQDMLAAVQTAATNGQQLSLEDAYESGCWANKTVRETLVAEREAEARRERQTKLKKAKRAARVPTQSEPAVVKSSDMTHRQALEANWDRLSGAA